MSGPDGEVSGDRGRASGQERVTDALGALDGARLPGGCDTCDAYQTVNATHAGVWTITVHHDNWCPFLTTNKETP